MEIKKKLTIPIEKFLKIQWICIRRTTENFSMEKLKADLLLFIRKELKLLLSTPDIKKKIEEGQLSNSERNYSKYDQYLTGLEPRTFSRAFGSQGISFGENQLLEEVVDFYIAGNPALIRDNPEEQKKLEPLGNFSAQTIALLSQRAGSLCSNPDCRQTTSGPIISEPEKAHVFGVACLIYGIKEGDPRYDPQVPALQDRAENGVWLCAKDAILVNAAPKDYPASLLQEWKQIHEQLIKACNEGKKRVFIAMNMQDTQSDIAAGILDFFEQQYRLFEEVTLQDREGMIMVVKETGDFLMGQELQIVFSTKLQEQVYAIDALCDAFFEQADIASAEAGISNLFSTFKKLLGTLLYEMAAHYKLELPVSVRSIVPDGFRGKS